MPAGTPKVAMFGGVSITPGGSQTFNASGTWTAPPGVKKVSITGTGGTGSAGNPGNAGQPSGGGNGGFGGSVILQYWLPSCCNYGTASYVPCACRGLGSPPNGGNANGNPGNPGPNGNVSTGLGYVFCGGNGGNGGSGGTAGGGSGNAGCNGGLVFYRFQGPCPGGNGGGCPVPAGNSNNASPKYSGGKGFPSGGACPGGGGGGGAGNTSAGVDAPKNSPYNGGAGGTCGGGAGGTGGGVNVPGVAQKGGTGGNATSGGAGGGGGGGGRAWGFIPCFGCAAQAGKGGGGGGRGTTTTGNSGNPGNPGSAGFNATYNCVSVTGGSNYPITVGTIGGSVKISWNPQ